MIFKSHSEKTLYIAGDTVWNEYVRSTIEIHEPEIIVLNAGDAQVPGLGSIIMGAADVKRVHEAAPNATLIASHMEAVNHCLLSRADLREYAKENGLAGRLLVPEDGESYGF